SRAATRYHGRRAASSPASHLDPEVLHACCVYHTFEHNTMAYVRSRGNQLLIVRGERAPGTKNVQQRILATIYSRPEARAILGRGADGDAARRFRSLLEHRHAGVRFDW